MRQARSSFGKSALDMNPDSELLIFAAAVVAAAATCLTAFGLSRRQHAGWAHWTAAQWLVCAGLLVGSLWPGEVGMAAATLLLLQWPVVALLGLRLFHARHAWPGNKRQDLVVLVLASVAAGVGTVLPEPVDLWVLAATSLGVHLYVAGVLFMAPAGRETTPLLALGAAVALAAFVPAAWQALLPSAVVTSGAEAGLGLALAARGIAAALGTLLLAFVVVTLACDRTEHQLRDSRRRLRALANLDALTQVPNRRHFHELARGALQQDPPGSAVLLLFDVDHFKQINDHLGHAAGDRALCLVSSSVTEHLRAPDVAGRHGGDEFVLLLRCADTRAGIGVAARIVAEVQGRAADAQLPPLSLSFGLVQVGAHEDIQSALRRADQALYEAKRQGRSRAVAASGDEAQPVFADSQRLGLLPN